MIGDRIREERLKKGLTQEDLAKAIQVSPSTIGMYEQNRRIPDNETLVKLADFFDTSIDILLYGFDRAKLTSLVNVVRYRRSIEKLSEDTGIDEYYLNRLCSGVEYKQPSIDTILKIAIHNDNVLVVDAESLFEAAGYDLEEISHELLKDIPLELLHRYQDQGLAEIEMVMAYIQFKNAKFQDRLDETGNIKTIAAHHAGEKWTEEELAELERFKEFLRSKRDEQK